MNNLDKIPGNISIGLMGDVMIGRLINDVLDDVPSNYIWGNTLPTLKKNNLNIINLEAALTTSEKRAPKVFNFKADPKNVSALTEASIHVVNIANNHILDYSEEGLIDTLKTLDAAKIKHVGAGNNDSEATSPVIFTVNGVKIGILGCTDNEPEWKAASDKAGTRYIKVGDIDTVREDILQLKKEVDLIVFSIHWGPNMIERPSQLFKNFAHELIDLGVDIIHGHSAHIFQGIEIYKNRIILYDTGDFIDDYYVDPYLRNDRSFLYIIQADKSGLHSLRLLPVLLSNLQVNIVRGSEAGETLKRMLKLSKEMYTNLELKDDQLMIRL